jgi:antitoxin component of MazEF toxin-antitoxin module
MPTELRVTRIGNSRGVRLPARVLQRYGIGETVVMEELTEGILLRPAGPAIPRLSIEETALEMARAAEDWSDWDTLAGEGLSPWPPRPARVVERKASYRPGRRRK